ncbi:MAG: T9SS type A sorting domain-containing protein [Bacteroidales bacterium]|nr:T9SS type A sorting domain-containing protein [Bacteroidales bacterium]
MKTKFYTLIALLAIVLAGIFPANGQTGLVTDTIYMGSGYSNEIYYSMSAGEKGKVNRSLWDIAFRTNLMSADIIINDGSGVELYTYPKADTSGWATVDITGMETWTKMYNSPTDWETGAFCINQKGHPDYGWCKYNATTHNLIGDSLFIIKLRDGSLRKLWIKEKYSSLNIYEFQFANINGTANQVVSLDCSPYTSKNFVGYDIALNQAVDFEPVAATQWDILFTKYYGLSGITPYPYTGVLSNYNVKSSKFSPVSLDFMEWYKASLLSTRSLIGAGWKSYNFSTNVFDIVDSLVYFVQDQGGVINKLVFKGFDIPTGRIILEKGAISFTAVAENQKSGFNAAVYPNPVSDVMNLMLNPGKATFALVSVIDITGHTVLNQRFDMQSEELSTIQVPVSELPSGIYMVKIQAGGNVIARKVLVNN